MLIREGDARSQSIDLRLAAILSSVAGALNAAGFELAGVFSANMTGNISAMADRLARGAFGYGLLFAGVVATFIFGAFLAGICIEIGKRRKLRSIYAQLVFAEGLLLLAVGVADILDLLTLDGMQLIFVLSFALGLQNATTTRISRARVRTTHISGMATDVGLAIAALTATNRDRAIYLGQLALHGSTIGAFLVGGVIGATVLNGLGPGIFLLCGLILLGVSGKELLRKTGS